MLTNIELQSLLMDMESDRIERTESLNNTDKFARAICAFANDLPNHHQPGFLLIGVKDDGSLAKTPITDQLLQNLAAFRSDGNILPLPSLRVYRMVLPEGEVGVVEVDPSDLPPVRYKGRICVRVGPRRADANEQEERLLSERRSSLVATWDIHPVPNAGLSELSTRLFSDYRTAILPLDLVEANHRTLEEQLAALRFFDLRRGVATVAGILVFGINPRFYLPGAYVQFLRFPGTTMADIPSNPKEIDGDLQTIVQALHGRVQDLNQTQLSQGEGFRDALKPDYPEWALRELLHNALIHRDYASTSPIRFTVFADRIELQNPGGPFGGLTRETLRKRNAYRNPVLAETMKSMGYVNRFGYGIQRADELLARNGNPPLELDVDAFSFNVTVRKRSP